MSRNYDKHKYDNETWAAAETTYISSAYSLVKVADMYGIPRTTLIRRAKKDGWVEKRDEYKDEISKAAMQDLKTEGIKRLKNITAAACRVEEIALEALEDKEQFYRYVMQERHADGSTTTEEYVLQKLDMNALKGYIKVLMDLISIMRNLYEIPEAEKRVSEEIARARLEIDRAKATAAGAKTDDDEELTGIIEIPAVQFEEQQDEE